MANESLFVQRFSRPSIRAFNGAPTTTNVFVANIPWAATREDLQSHFVQFGAVDSVRIISDRESGRSKGYGFVNFVDAAAAEKAISSLDGTEFMGRTLSVRPKENRVVSE